MTANINAALVKELRERTGAGMMECKKALINSHGDLEGAIEELRKSGASKAGRKAGRVAAEGEIKIAEGNKIAVLLEVNCETDFVTRDPHFAQFVDVVAKTILEKKPNSLDELANQVLFGHDSETIETARQNLVAKIGENIQIRRFMLSHPEATSLGTYVHNKRIGVIVELDVENKELARDIAMHIAASRPLVIHPDDVDPELVNKEKEIYSVQAATSGKPAEIVEKMVIGRLKKFLDEVSLVGQPFVRDPETTVGSLLNKHRAKVLNFYRYEVGEGIDKVTSDFKEEVMSQVKNG